MGTCGVRAEPVCPLGWYVKIKVSKKYDIIRTELPVKCTVSVSVGAILRIILVRIDQSQQERSRVCLNGLVCEVTSKN